jgi:hypothetical protein
MSEQKNKPVKNFKAGACQASIWRQEAQNNGQTVVRYSVKLQKQFKNDKGDWQATDYLFPEDLPKIELVVRKAFEYVSLNKNADNQSGVAE